MKTDLNLALEFLNQASILISRNIPESKLLDEAYDNIIIAVTIIEAILDRRTL